MDVERRWYCNCTGKLVELNYSEAWEEDEDGASEPACERCGATPSSDPKHTLVFRDAVGYDD